MDFRILGVSILGYMVLKSSLSSRVPVPDSPVHNLAINCLFGTEGFIPTVVPALRLGYLVRNQRQTESGRAQFFLQVDIKRVEWCMGHGISGVGLRGSRRCTAACLCLTPR